MYILKIVHPQGSIIALFFVRVVPANLWYLLVVVIHAADLLVH